MKNTMIMKAAALLAIGALHACGGGSGGGGFSMPTAVSPETTPATSEKPAATPVLWARRALDTVSPAAGNGDLDIEVSPDLANAFGRVYSLDTPGGVNVAPVAVRGASTGGLFFPQTPSLVKLAMPQVAPGSYVLRVKGIFVGPGGAPVTSETTMPVLLNGFPPALASLSYSFGARRIALRFTSAISGTLFTYPTGQASGVCTAKTAAELAATPNVQATSVTGSTTYFTGSHTAGDAYAHGGTMCLQFMRETDSVVEAPYTFNLRYRRLPASGDLLLTLDASPLTVAKEALSLVSLPRTSSNFFDWIERRQIFALGDAHQHATSNSARITLEQAQGTWQYRIAAPVPTDPRFYVAKVEGRPPLVLVMVD